MKISFPDFNLLNENHQSMKYKDLEEIAIIITNGGTASLLLVLSLAIVITYFATRFIKKGELDEINSNFEAIKNQQLQLTVITETIKNELNNKSIEYQIKLQAYNEKKIIAIEQVYISLIKLKEAAKTLGFDYKEKNRKAYSDSVEQFRHQHELNRLWIPDKIYDIFERVAIEIDNNASPYIIIKGAEENSDPEKYWLSMPDEKFEVISNKIEKFHDYLSKEVDIKLRSVVQNILEDIVV